LVARRRAQRGKKKEKKPTIVKGNISGQALSA